ncbi:MAG: T9SS type A sorting domain-containing protein [bacterium]|nr:T9SS type A sorting domain-containing protein [bacterium]
MNKMVVILFILGVSPNIAVTPDILKFAWGVSSEKSSFIGHSSINITNEISHTPKLICNKKIISMPGIGADFLPEKKNKLGGKADVIDTLLPILDPPFFWWQSSYRIEYEATQLTPVSPCSVITLIHGVVSPTAGASKQCSLFIWSDLAGSPGTKLFKAEYTATADSANQAFINKINIIPRVYVTGPFWVGNYEADTLFPTSIVDSLCNSSKYYNPDSSQWVTDYADYFHGAIVKYVEAPHYDTLTTMTITNTGDANLNVTNITKSDSWIVSVNPTNFTVAPGNSRDINVIVTRDGLSAGTHYGSLSVYSNDPDTSTYIEPVKFVIVDVGAEEKLNIKNQKLNIKIKQNLFSQSTVINYEIPATSKVSLKLYDITGSCVKTLINEEKPAGSYSIALNADKLKTGIYFVRLTAVCLSARSEESSIIKETKKLILMK